MSWLDTLLQGYRTIASAGTALSTARQTLNFVGATVADNPATEQTDVTITGGGVTIQEEGAPLATTASTLNFIGPAITAAGGGATKSVTVASINLAGGATWVTGILPKANQGAQDMAGDVTGNTGASVVAKVNGATVPASGALTTGNAAYVTGVSALTYSALNLAGGAGYVTGTLPVGNLPAMGGDVSGTISSTAVIAITGSAGAVDLATTSASFNWRSGTVAPTIKQVDVTTNSATGAAITIQSQNATGTTATGGALNLTSGTGTSVAGNVVVKTGGTTRLTCSPTLLTSTNPMVIGASPAATGTIRLEQTASIVQNDGGVDRIAYVGAASSQSFGAAGTSNCYYQGVNCYLISSYAYVLCAAGGPITCKASTVNMSDAPGSGSGVIITPTYNGAASVVFGAATTSCGVSQADNSTNGATAATMTVQSANASGTTSTGGILELKSGSGTTVYGELKVLGPANVGFWTQAMADAPQTLSNLRSINNMIRTTGANTAVRALTLTRPPTSGAMVFVRNDCTVSGITVQFASGAATGTILPGTSVLVAGDGTNAFIVMTGA